MEKLYQNWKWIDFISKVCLYQSTPGSIFTTWCVFFGEMICHMIKIHNVQKNNNESTHGINGSRMEERPVIVGGRA